MPIQTSEAYSFKLGYELALKDSLNRLENILALPVNIPPHIKELIVWHRDSTNRALTETHTDIEDYRTSRKLH